MTSVPHSDMPAVTGCMWLFRTTGQLVGVAATSAILQGTLGRELEERLRGDGAAELIRQIRSDSSILSSLPLEVRLPAREAYALALEHMFWFCALGAIGAWFAVCSVPNLDLSASARPSSRGAEGEEDGERRPLLRADEGNEAIAGRRVEEDEEEERAAVVRRP